MTEVAASERTAGPKHRAGGYWKFWGTTLWGLAIIASFAIIEFGGVFGALVWLDPGRSVTTEDVVAALFDHKGLLLTIFAVAIAGALAVLALAVRLSGLGMRDYLGLVLPGPRDVVVGLAGLVIVSLVVGLIAHLFGGSQAGRATLGMYRSARGAGLLPAMIVGVVIVAPIVEELVFRGFLLPGWAASRLGTVGGLVLSSVVWALLHFQYDVWGIAMVFCYGLWFGFVRLRSGSTLATMILHVLQNGAAILLIVAFYP
jgi:uncharacterized protein